MRSPSSSELLDIWEQGNVCSNVYRALLLLSRAFPEQSLVALAELTIGQRDGYLLELRQLIFGSQVTGLATCPNCSERIEVDLHIADLRNLSPEPAPPSLFLEQDHYSIEFRLPTSKDLESLPAAQAAQMKQALLARCLLAIKHQGEACALQNLPESVIETLLKKMAEADPQADTQLLLVCPECQHHWQLGFDIVSFFWQELDLWARQTLGEIHQLAMTYGWREVDILALSPWRRHYYLELCQS